MARLNAPSASRPASTAAKIVDSDSDHDDPDMSTIFSARSIATPRKELVPKGEETGVRTARRRVLGGRTDNVLLRRLGRDSPALGTEGGKKRAMKGKTLFDEEDEKPRARRGMSRPAVRMGSGLKGVVGVEDEESEEEDEVEEAYVRPRAVRRAPRTVGQSASAKEEAVMHNPKTRDVLEDFGKLQIGTKQETKEVSVSKPRPARSTRGAAKPVLKNYVEPESSEEEVSEEKSESEDDSLLDKQPVRSIRVASKPSPPIHMEPGSDGENDGTEENEARTQSESEEDPEVMAQPERSFRSIPMVIIPAYEPERVQDSEEEAEEEMDVLEASCLGNDSEPEPIPEAIPRAVPQARLPSNIFNALQHLPPPRAPRPTVPHSDTEVEEDNDQEHLDTLEASCLEDDDEADTVEGQVEAPVAQVYEHQESEEEEDDQDDDSDDISDFIVSDGEEEISNASDSDVVSSEEESPTKPAARSVRRLVQGRRNASPPPASKVDLKKPIVDFQWSDDDKEEENRPAPTSRKLFGTSTTNRKLALPTLSDSEDEDASPILDPYTPSGSDSETRTQMPEKERTPRSNKLQPSPSKRLKSPTKPKFPRLPVVSPPRRQSNDAFWEPEVINKWQDEYSPQKKLFQSPTKSAKPISRLQLGGASDEIIDVDLLKSPTKASTARAKKAEKDTIKHFEATKHSIALSFLEELDQKVCAGEIGRMSASTGGVQIIWSAKLNTTAGRAHWKRDGTRARASASNPNPEAVYSHHCSIELAQKVITDTHRLINVLAHEFCHLATFMISKQLQNPHGKEFKEWGRKVERVFGQRDVEVTTKHSYEIHWRFLWRCQGCAREVGRHSKSLDLERVRCGACRGRLVQVRPVPRGGVPPMESKLFPDAQPRDGDTAFFDGTIRESSSGGKAQAKPKQLTDYQVFVKENMARIKAENPGSPMKEVMGLVGAKYREQKAGRKLFGEGGRLKEIKLKSAQTEEDVEKMVKAVEVLDLTSP